MKKFLALVLALAMTLALAACGGNSQQNSSTPNAGQKEDAQPPTDSQGGGASGTIKIGGIGPLTGSTPPPRRRRSRRWCSRRGSASPSPSGCYRR